MSFLTCRRFSRRIALKGALLLPALALTLLGSVLVHPSGIAAAQAQDDGGVIIPGEVLVAVRENLDNPTAVARLEQALGRVVERVPALHVYRFKLQAGLSVSEAIARAQQFASVAYAEPNHTIVAFGDPDDTYYLSYQWGAQKVQANLAWDLWNPQAQTVVAVVDTGINLSHTDLTSKIYRDSAGNVIGYDFVNSDSDPSDDNGHGTHCAGIAGAQSNNAEGIAGIAGWNSISTYSDTANTKLMAVKVLNSSGSGTLSGVANGITYAADNGAKVISLSLGSGRGSTTLSNAVSYAWNKGCVLVAAAGNSGSSSKSYPAAYPNVISVASTDTNDTLSSFSNYGSWVLCAAPGEYILSTYGGGYAWASGTSMATPHVAGEVALLASQAPALSNQQLKDTVLTYVDPVNPYGSRTIGGGRINVYRALYAVTYLPAAPSGLTAKAVSKSQIDLAWTDNASNEDGFHVERSTDGKTFSVLATLGVNTASYSDAALSANTTYYYRVRAYNSYGDSTYSNTASAKTLRR